MALASAYAGIPTPVLLIGGAGAAALLVYAVTRPGPAQIAPEPAPPPPPPPPEYGVEVGPSVLETPDAPTPPAADKPYTKLPGDLFTLKPGKFYRMRLDIPSAQSNFPAYAALPFLAETTVRDRLGFDQYTIFSNARFLDPAWPPDALAGGAFPFFTYWAQGYWTKAPKVVAKVVPDGFSGTKYPRVTNIWEY